MITDWTEETIRSYILRSAGNCNHMTEHTITCFIGMLETGEATIADFRRIAASISRTDGEWLIKQMADSDVWKQSYEERYA